MRSSKSRSRNKNNNNNRRSVGNVVNRVFDSSGPEGKVRGTPQQIIEKYQTLARDAQLSNDRVALENFQQHAEHYTRMLGEAMREQEARREQQENQQQNQNRGQRNDRNDRNERDPSDGESMSQDAGSAPQPHVSEQPAAQPAEQPAAQPQPTEARSAPRSRGPRKPAGDAAASASDVIDLNAGSDDSSGLVETPESAPPRKPRTRTRRKKTDDSGSSPAPAPATDQVARPASSPAPVSQPESAPEAAPEVKSETPAAE